MQVTVYASSVRPREFVPGRGIVGECSMRSVAVSAKKRHHKIKILGRGGLMGRNLNLMSLHKILGVFFRSRALRITSARIGSFASLKTYT
jgi:hypothetical protein